MDSSLKNNGCFIVSTNNIMWHSFDKSQRKRIITPEGVRSLQSKNNLFECRYIPMEEKLSFYINGKELGTLLNVKPDESDCLTPCLVFLKNCKVQTTFDYPNEIN